MNANSNLVYKHQRDQQMEGHKIPWSFINNKILDADKQSVSCQRKRTWEHKNISR